MLNFMPEPADRSQPYKQKVHAFFSTFEMQPQDTVNRILNELFALKHIVGTGADDYFSDEENGYIFALAAQGLLMNGRHNVTPDDIAFFHAMPQGIRAERIEKAERDFTKLANANPHLWPVYTQSYVPPNYVPTSPRDAPPAACSASGDSQGSNSFISRELLDRLAFSETIGSQDVEYDTEDY